MKFLHIHGHLSTYVPVVSSELVSHPDRHFVDALLNNLTNGCNIGYTGPQFNHSSQNLHSAYQHLTILDATIAEECKLGRFWGHLTSPHFPHFAPQALDWCPSMMETGEPYVTCQLLMVVISIATLIWNHSPLPTVQWMMLMQLSIPWERHTHQQD